MKTKRMALKIAFPTVCLLVLILLASLCSLRSSAATSGTWGNTRWSYDASTKKLTFTGTGAMPGWLDEEGEMREIPWSSVGPIVDVEIGEGITSVTEYSLTEVSGKITLPSTMKTVGDWLRDSGMQEVVLKNGTTTIAASAFKGCFNLKKITIPDTVTSIGGNAFRNCPIEVLTIPGSVKVISEELIIASEVKKIILQEGVREIKDYAFSGCSQLESVQLPSTLESIGGNVFEFSAFQSLTIPASVKTIRDTAFQSTGAMTSLKFLGDAPKVLKGNGTEASELLLVDPELNGGEQEVTIYYNKYASGWTTPTWNGVKTVAYDPCEKGHTYGTWSVTSAASCTKDGTETRTCSACKTTETRTVAKTAHAFGAWSVTKAATATATGTETRKCNNCPQTETRTIPKLTSSDKPVGNTSASTDVNASTNTSSDSNTEVDVPVIDPPVLDTEVNTTKPENNALSGNIGGTADELKDALLTEAEKQAVADGDAVQIYLNVTDIAENLLDIQKTAIETEAGNKTVVAWLDISLFKQVGEADSEKITEPGKAVVIALTVPEEYRTPEAGMKRIFSVIRDHNRTLETLPASFDAPTGLLTFSTDGFSTYALAYEDVATENPGADSDSNVDPATDLPAATNSDGSAEGASFPWWIVIVCGAVVLAAGGAAVWYFLIFKKKNPAEPKE